MSQLTLVPLDNNPPDWYSLKRQLAPFISDLVIMGTDRPVRDRVFNVWDTVKDQIHNYKDQ